MVLIWDHICENRGSHDNYFSNKNILIRIIFSTNDLLLLQIYYVDPRMFFKDLYIYLRNFRHEQIKKMNKLNYYSNNVKCMHDLNLHYKAKKKNQIHANAKNGDLVIDLLIIANTF